MTFTNQVDRDSPEGRALLSMRNGMKRTPLRRKVQAETWTYDCGAIWPVHFMPEEHRKGYDTYFRKEVQDAAHKLGWVTYHAHLPFFDDPGMSDLYLQPDTDKLRRAGFKSMWRELKVRNLKGQIGSTSPEQQRFINREIKNGGDAKVWVYPDDWFGQQPLVLLELGWTEG